MHTHHFVYIGLVSSVKKSSDSPVRFFFLNNTLGRFCREQHSHTASQEMKTLCNTCEKLLGGKEQQSLPATLKPCCFRELTLLLHCWRAARRKFCAPGFWLAPWWKGSGHWIGMGICPSLLFLWMSSAKMATLLAASRTKWFLLLSSLALWGWVFGTIFGAIDARVPGLMLGMSSSYQQPKASYSLKTSMLQSSKSSIWSPPITLGQEGDSNKKAPVRRTTPPEQSPWLMCQHTWQHQEPGVPWQQPPECGCKLPEAMCQWITVTEGGIHLT